MNRLKLRNITDSTDEIFGVISYTGNDNVDGDGTTTIMKGVITIDSVKTFEIQHRCQSTRLADGYGLATGFGDDEIYTQVTIRKLR
jgi:hypothetical protein